MNKRKVFKYENKLYPNFIKEGNAVKYVREFANYFCKGKGLDIGGFDTWVLDGAKPINISIDDEFDAMNLPNEKYDYIFSSHCLEHLEKPFEALKYWIEHLKDNGVIFLYLPHHEMRYWRPDRNKKHLHTFDVYEIMENLRENKISDIIYSERDLYFSFSVVGYKEC